MKFADIYRVCWLVAFTAVVATWNQAQPEPTALSVLAMLLPAVWIFPWLVTEPGAAPKVTSDQHIADDGLMLGLQRPAT